MFCAVALLYVYAIHYQHTNTNGPEILTLAIKCHAQLSTMTEEHSLASRYCAVLEELQKEALRPSHEATHDRADQTDRSDAVRSQSTGNPEAHSYSAMEPVVQLPTRDMDPLTTVHTTAPIPGSDQFPDVSGWGVLDSVVSSTTCYYGPGYWAHLFLGYLGLHGF